MFLLSVTIFLTIYFCYGGNFSSVYDKIDSLIENKDYSNALILLENHITANPKDFDNAQKRISKIMQAREDYSNIAQELIDVLNTDPTNDKKQLDIISILESLEKNPNSKTTLFIQHAKSAAQFSYFKSQYDKIMAEGKKLFEQKEYFLAAKKFETGLELYQKEFFEQNYNNDITNTVKNGLKQIAEVLNNYFNCYSELLIAINEYENNLKTENFEICEKSLKRLDKTIKKFSEFRNIIATEGNNFYTLFLELQNENSELTEASFLPFAFRFTLGKQNDSSTGILASFDYIWDDILPELINSAEEKINSQISETLNFINEKDFFTTDESNIVKQCANKIKYTTKLFSLAKNTEKLNRYRIHIDKKPILLDDSYNLVYDNLDNILKNYDKEFSNAIDLAKQIQNSTQLKDTDKSYTEKLINYSKTFATFAQNAKNTQVKIKTDYEDFFADTTLSTEAKAIYNDYLAFLDNIINTSLTSQLNQWNLIGKKYGESTNTILAKYQNSLTEATKLLNEDKSQLFSYPQQSIDLLQKELLSFNSDLNTLSEYLLTLSSAPNTEVKNNSQAAEYHKNLLFIQNTINSLNTYQLDCNKIIAKAQNQVLQSQKLKNEADLRYEQALEALKQNNYQQAKDFLQRASTRYTESLAIQESETIRKESDELLYKLGSEITRSENSIVVQDVRKYTNQARQEYYNGNFEKAENFLTLASARWNATNIEENPEITNLFTLVNTALSMKTGRTILPTAPLYPEMSQLLNSANQYFENGKQLLLNNKRTEAITELNLAKDKLHQVKLVYPINQEANLLTLKIDQLIDKNAFNASFEKKINDALKNIDLGKEVQTAYSDLLNLYEINPEYPGLKNKIYNTEIKLGFRLPPPNKKDLAQSDSLTQEAMNILNKSSRNEIELNTALAKINQALKLNPDNQSAMQTKDRISSLIGGTLSVVLTAADEAIYNRAIRELSQGNKITAQSLVAQLLQNKRNQNSYKVLDLKKRLESLL